MLAQELFMGYNQRHLPKRCALKVDLRKAYDTVEWDFLLEVLRLFGFPSRFIGWIEECVTTPSYSVCINGEAHGFLRGARDDLLLFCAADDHSIGLFQRGLDLFASLSGLHVNPAKSQLILSKAAHTERTQLLQLLDFQEGILPVRYLGLPLISSRLSLAACRPLCKRSMTAMAFVLPKGVIKEIERRLRSFLWQGTTGSGYSKVAWARVCTPIEEGGLGIRNLSALNMAMIARKLWERFLELEEDASPTSMLLPHITFRIGDGTRFSLWHDPWHQLGPLISRYPLGPNATGTHSADRLQRMIVDGSWRWPAIPGMGGGHVEIHQHLFFDCQYSRLCLASIRRRVRFPWPFRDWMTGIRWASSRWRGKHVVNAAYLTLLASVVYHIWQERNHRQFQNEERTPMVLGRCIVEECRQRIITDNLPSSISTCALYRI
ncbi:UNVERIFIED_CONTAM: hypothetical protein Slati_3434100 [Sesamum latifolium]|uniref:Reverse transcriptase domain-containing protein n=1 Tax=Sesamum latifolium TaxID=2727402 RepID=A0AAW2UGB4_9LAMI